MHFSACADLLLSHSSEFLFQFHSPTRVSIWFLFILSTFYSYSFLRECFQTFLEFFRIPSILYFSGFLKFFDIFKIVDLKLFLFFFLENPIGFLRKKTAMIVLFLYINHTFLFLCMSRDFLLKTGHF